MNAKIRILSLFIFLFVHNSLAVDMNKMPSCAEKTIVGKSESVLLLENNLVLPAKIDTGASMSSLSAIDIHSFKHDNKIWLQFAINSLSKHGLVIFREPLIGYVHILKRQEELILNEKKIDPKQYNVRPTVMMSVCIGHQKQSILVNLTDRSYFRYQMLIGEDALKKFNFLVDVSKENIAMPACKK